MLKANPKTIGAFVVGGLVLFIAGLVTFGSFTFFAARLPIVMYFSGDLTGLDEGAPLLFRGVRIGTVTDVSLHFNTQTLKTMIPVHADIEPERFVIEGQEDKAGKNVPLLIKEGLRAQLAAQSLLTGKLLVRLDIFPDTPADLAGQDKKIVEIPTVPSAMAELQQGLQGVLNKIEQMPLAELVEGLRTAITDIDNAVKQVDTKSYGDAAQAAVRALEDTRKLIANLDQRIDELAPASLSAIKNADQTAVQARQVLTDMRPLLTRLQHAAESADSLLVTAQGVIEPGSPAYRELVSTLREFSNTARSVRALADDLERNPDSVLFGKASVRSGK
jgi:paraquat-inducible protein B